jgi:hypothetical protein
MDHSPSRLRAEIAAAAAVQIADGGLDYGAALRKAVAQCCGTRPPRGSLPDVDEIDEALREHLDLFDEDHGARVQMLRETGLALMEALAAFRPLITGAAWKGIAAGHAPLHLQLFPDNPKEVSYWLLDRGIDADVETIAHFRSGEAIEALAFEWQDVPVLLSLYDPDDLRGALRDGPAGPLRGDRAALAARLRAEP